MNAERFAITPNVKKFVTAVEAIIEREHGMAGMGLVHGETGLGKTWCAQWYAVQNQYAKYITAKVYWTLFAMYGDILTEMGIRPGHSSAIRFAQIVQAAKDHDYVFLIDDAERLNTKLMEGIRDIHDCTEMPIIMIGMKGFDNTIRNISHFFGRMLELVEFQPIAKVDDVMAIAKKRVSLPMEREVASALLTHTKGDIRRLVILLFKINRFALRCEHEKIELKPIKPLH